MFKNFFKNFLELKLKNLNLKSIYIQVHTSKYVRLLESSPDLQLQIEYDFLIGTSLMGITKTKQQNFLRTESIIILLALSSLGRIRFGAKTRQSI